MTRIDAFARRVSVTIEPVQLLPEGVLKTFFHSLLDNELLFADGAVNYAENDARLQCYIARCSQHSIFEV